MNKYFGFHLYDGDQDMSEEYKNAISQEKVTEEIRDKFFSRLIKSVEKLQNQYDKIVITQTFIKEKYRLKFQRNFPHARFILIETRTDIREKRIMVRDEFELTLEKWRRMTEIFEEPKIDNSILYNDQDGEESLKIQLQLLPK